MFANYTDNTDQPLQEVSPTSFVYYVYNEVCSVCVRVRYHVTFDLFMYTVSKRMLTGISGCLHGRKTCF